VKIGLNYDLDAFIPVTFGIAFILERTKMTAYAITFIEAIT